MVDEPDGEWVRREDYDALRAEHCSLRLLVAMHDEALLAEFDRTADSAPAGPAKSSPNEHAQRCDNCGRPWTDHKPPEELCPSDSADVTP